MFDIPPYSELIKSQDTARKIQVLLIDEKEKTKELKVGDVQVATFNNSLP